MTEMFDASSVPELAYNFDKWLGTKSEHQGPDIGKVIIPEPSVTAVSDFLNGWITVLNSAAGHFTPEKAPEDHEEKADERDERISRNLAAETIAANKLRGEKVTLIAALCQATPSEETLLKLPHRVSSAFEGYLLRMLRAEA